MTKTNNRKQISEARIKFVAPEALKHALQELASERLIIPVSTGFFALTGLVQLQESIDMVKQTQLNPELEILGVLCTFSDRTNVSKDVEQQLRDYFGDLVFETVIPKNVSLEEAHSNHRHIFDYAPNSTGARAYKALVKEVLKR